LALFLEEALANYPSIASVAPSSRHLARAMAEPLRHMKAGVVVELGAGTGVITRALLELLPEDAILIVFEINKKFYRYLRRNFNDPRLLLINDCAETLGRYLAQLGLKRVDAMVSSLSFSLMTARQRHAILNSLFACLDGKSVFLQYHYLPARLVNALPQPRKNRRLNVPRLLHQHFGSVESRIVWRNLPPALVYACKRKRAVIPHLREEGRIRPRHE
jgi:phosphatidylethanolamine/phosphatidyl-N-methylethanolamine N-methyltransferase